MFFFDIPLVFSLSHLLNELLDLSYNSLIYFISNITTGLGTVYKNLIHPLPTCWNKKYNIIHWNKKSLDPPLLLQIWKL
jgi:hypothetical protein